MLQRPQETSGFLGAHGAYFGLEEKYARLQKGEMEAFVDRDGYRKFVADKSAEFQAALQSAFAADRPTLIEVREDAAFLADA